MSSRPWMPLYVTDFCVDTLDLRTDETGVYMVMLMLAWRREDAALPNDMGWLKRTLGQCFADFHGHHFNRIVPKLLDRYFLLGEDGKYRNKRLTNERQKTDKRSAKQSQNANKRWFATKDDNGLADAAAMPLQSQSQLHKKKEDAPSGASSSKGYFFECGVIKLNKKNFEDWETAFTNLDLRAELTGLAQWAGKQPDWYHAVAGALAKRNREVGIKIKTPAPAANARPLTRSGERWPDGII